MPDPHPGKFLRPNARQIGQQNQTLRKAEKTPLSSSRQLITPNPCTVFVRNKTGETLGRIAVLAITGVEITPEDNETAFLARPVLSGETPTGTEPVFVITQEPLAPDAIGRAIAIGPVAVCKVDILDDGHTHAKLTDSSSSLESDASGPGTILFKETGTGVKWAVLLLGGGGSGTCAEVEEFWIEETPTSGTAIIGFELDRDPDDATDPVYETFSVPYNATSNNGSGGPGTFATALYGHSILAAGSGFPNDCDVVGGPFPHQSIYVIWKGDFAGRSIPFCTLNSNDLNNGAKIKHRKASSADWKGYL